MAGSNKKAPYLKDSDHLERLVKEHIKHDLDPTKHSGLWKSTDLDKVVGHYQDFLAAMAMLGSFFDHQVFVKVLKKLFEGDPTVLKNFAKVMSQCLTNCKLKSKMISSGAKTHAAVLRVARARAKHSSSQSLDTEEQTVEKSEQSDSELEFLNMSVGEAEVDAKTALAQAHAMFSSSS